MLNMLRKRAQSTLIQIIVLIIAIVFVFWGVGTNLGNKKNTLATVNGEEIPYQDFQRAYDSTVDNYRQQFGGSIPPGFLDGLGLQQQVINQLVKAEIFRQSGREMGITLSKLSTQDEIKDMEVFKDNGQFDLNRYKEVLAQNRMNPASFEAGLRNDLFLRKVQDVVNGFSMVTDSEIQSRFEFTNEEINIAYLQLKSDDFQDKVEIQDDELAEWYNENKNKYLSKPKVRLKYLFFDFDDDMAQMTVSDETIQARYESNNEKYVIPEQRHARHILFKVTEADDEQVRIDKRKKAEEVLLLSQGGQDFAELAKKYSEGPSGPSGGDLGFFKSGAMVESFDDVVFQLQAGEISGVVETVFGYHIIKLEEIKPGTTRSLDDVRTEIVEEIKKEDVKGYTFKRASKSYEDIIRSGSLDKYSENQSGNVQKTDFFTRSTPPEAPVSYPKFLQTAFSLKKGELSSLVETGKGYAIIFVDDIQQSDVPELDSVRDKVVEDYTKAKSIDLAREKAELILTESRDQGNFAEIASSAGEVKESGFIKRSALSSVADLPAPVVQKAFSLYRDALPEEPFVQGNIFYVFQMLERRQSDAILDDTTREQLEKQLKTSAQQKLLAGWLTCMQDRADIRTNLQMLQ